VASTPDRTDGRIDDRTDGRIDGRTDARTRTRTRTRTGGRALLALAGFIALAFVAGAVGALLQGDGVSVRYLALERPAWAPDSSVFGIVWPVLYLLIGIAGWLVWRSRADGVLRTAALAGWGAQLVLNALWPWVFFGQEAFGPAIGVIVALDLVVIATVAMAWRVSRAAAGLLLPYLVWILYATALNIAIFALN
jgi:translocator protein